MIWMCGLRLFCFYFGSFILFSGRGGYRLWGMVVYFLVGAPCVFAYFSGYMLFRVSNVSVIVAFF